MALTLWQEGQRGKVLPSLQIRVDWPAWGLAGWETAVSPPELAISGKSNSVGWVAGWVLDLTVMAVVSLQLRF